MDQKLLFEVDLRDESQSLADRLRQLRALSRDAVSSGELDALGERVFTDTRVRAALANLATNPPREFMKLLSDRLGHPAVSSEALRRSLVRVLDGDVTTPAPLATEPTPASAKGVGPAVPPKGKEYDLDHHIGGKSSLIRELFEAVDNYAESLGGDVSRRIRKFYVGYFRGKRSFFTVEVQKSRILLYLCLDPASTKLWNDAVMRDTTNIGHFGMGDVEYSLTTAEQLGDARSLIEAAYGR
ncbi:DUF5655 domain-containing protein [Ornithinimicrobium sediminis]|uniref:DUF5655 domain-containing protein n=1 Tax=Ornithinimicrobium sediminis TaxID=2904603 RepID=UPI001E33D307|nr:DUF5655 domain-containing protein [Ornithinimicrobium sediminis]MCE0488272.1 DUF5655 domain-containing protein [Ornithinimicrobium sediminis]